MNFLIKGLRKQHFQIKIVYPDNLIYKYKGFTADAKLKEFDNAFGLVDKKRDYKISLADAKKTIKQNFNQI